MKMISPSNREVDVGKTLSETEYIGMCRREVMDAYLRDRAEKLGATVINGLMMRMEQPGGWVCCAALHVCRSSSYAARPCMPSSLHCNEAQFGHVYVPQAASKGLKHQACALHSVTAPKVTCAESALYLLVPSCAPRAVPSDAVPHDAHTLFCLQRPTAPSPSTTTSTWTAPRSAPPPLWRWTW
jgi:hypothetical protein